MLVCYVWHWVCSDNAASDGWHASKFLLIVMTVLLESSMLCEILLYQDKMLDVAVLPCAISSSSDVDL
jgi:hypothetical protein